MQICARNTVTDVFPSSAKSSSHVRSRTFHGCKPASSYQFRRIAHNGEIKRARDEMERRRNGGGIELADLSSLRSSTYLRLSSLACARALLRVAQVYGIHGSAQGGCLSPDTRTFTVVVSAFYIYIYVGEGGRYRGGKIVYSHKERVLCGKCFFGVMDLGCIEVIYASLPRFE